jgi:hypothetical protein
MARRRRPELPPSESPLPFWLRPENVVVEDFVEPEEQPPADWIGDDRCWRGLRAWRRWQDAVTEWGAERGFDTSELRNRGLYPYQRPRFGDIRPVEGTCRLSGCR